MDKDFTDYETSKMLKELQLTMFATHLWNGDDNPPTLISMNHKQSDKYIVKRNWYSAFRWQEIKEWLWEKHKIGLFVFGDKELTGSYYNCEGSFHASDSRIFKTKNFESPIKAEIEGIKSTIKHLHSPEKQY